MKIDASVEESGSLAVWKYSLALVDGAQPLVMPLAAKLLRVSAQGSEPTIWALVNPGLARVTRKFVVVGTGHPVPPHAVYVGSCDERVFVWHVFEVSP